MSDFRLPGLATGLDTSSIIQQLMAIERRPINQMEAKKKVQNTIIDRLRALSTKFSALENAAKAVVGGGALATSPLGAKTAASSNKAVFTASASGSATPGTYSMEVVNLAKAQKRGGNDFLGVVADGQIRIRNLTDATKTTDIDVFTTDTAATLAARINGDPDSGLAASVVSGKLVLLGKNTGDDENYAITELSGSGNLLTEIGLQADPVNDVVAADAKIKLAGVEVESSSNVFANAVSGVTITAVSVGAGETLTVTKDMSATVGAVKEMIAKYNDIITQLREDTKYDPTTKKGGALVGDPFAGNLAVTLNRMVTEQFSPAGQNADLLSYSYVGIKVNQDGTLTLDEAKLTAKLDTNPNEVFALFAREDGAVDGGNPAIKLNQGMNGGNMGDGIAQRLRWFANAMISSNSEYNAFDASGSRLEGGLLNRISSAQKRVSSIDKRIDQYEERLEKRERYLRNQFIAMERSVALLRNQGSYLAGQFGGGAPQG